MKSGSFILVVCLLASRGNAQTFKDFFYGGMPQTNGAITDMHITVITNIAYVVGYDETRKNPAWVAYKLVKKRPAFRLERPTIGYPEDDLTLSKVPANAYSDSPRDPLIGRLRWDHGHMAANNAIAKVFGRAAQIATFKMSNMCPQSHRLNGGKWKVLEEREYNYSQRFGKLWTMCGPIYGKKLRTLRHGIEVPSGFYKILVRDDGDEPKVLAITFDYYPPTGDNALLYLNNHIGTVRDLESATGLDFFNTFTKAVQDNLETTKPLALW